jgi:inositol phosphorylceramide mannosyltransferase catalytic subunit
LSGVIPKIIHQTWKTDQVPEEWCDCVQSWKRLNPEWAYHLWTDEEGRRFVAEHYPDFLKTYEGYSYNIQRADAIRYLLLYKYGGVYVDLDFECFRSIDELLIGKTMAIGLEPQKHAQWQGREWLLSNAFMASVPGHPFLSEVISAMEVANPRISFHQDVLKTTGPILLTDVAGGYLGGGLCLLKEKVLFPFTSNSVALEILKNKGPGHDGLKASCIENGGYAIHYWANTWVRDLAGALHNPNPHGVEGYTFHPGVDSPGYDIRNVGRNIQVLKSECDKNSHAMGFNTDGFLKYHIQPPSSWVPMKSAGENEGLYVKNTS